MKSVYAVTWDEYDSWAGPSRGAAYSLHLNTIDAGRFFQRMRNTEYDIHQGRTPDNYLAPQGPGKTVLVSDKVYDTVAKSEDGVWAAKIIREEYIA